MSDIMSTILEVGTPVLVALLGFALTYLSKWLKEKSGNEALGNIMVRMTTEINTFVKEANQVLVAEIKKAKSPKSKGGKKLTKEEAQEIKNKVLNKFKELWGINGLAKISKVLGLSESGVDEFIEAKIEEAIHDIKNP